MIDTPTHTRTWMVMIVKGDFKRIFQAIPANEAPEATLAAMHTVPDEERAEWCVMTIAENVDG